MQSVKTPNVMLTEDFQYGSGRETKTIPKGSFVKPIQPQYLPKHIIDDKQWRYFNASQDIFCHTKFGIVPMPKRILIEA